MPVLKPKKIAGVALVLILLVSCVDQIEYDIANRMNLIVVEGRLTDTEGPQVIKINRSKAEYGRFGSTPIGNAKVEVLTDGQVATPLTEKAPGEYALPDGFRAKPGSRYQLRFTLSDGTRYESTSEVMPSVPRIDKTDVRFEANEPFAQGSPYKGVHNFYIDTRDPAAQENYYSWEYTIYEKKKWCRTCDNGVYAVNAILPGQYRFSLYYVSGNVPYEDCFTQPLSRGAGAPVYLHNQWQYDYECRDHCWEILQNDGLNLFEDRNTNGGQILQRKVARVPYYQCSGALIEIRQLSLTRSAYLYFSRFREQTQSTGGLADTPPTALAGNIRNVADSREVVIGYFTASSVAKVRHWIDRKDTGRLEPPGLFEALNKRNPGLEPNPPDMAYIMIWDGPPRVPRATCLESDKSTSHKPEGWVDQENKPDCLK